jgi:predicted Zn-dependent protease
MRKRLALLILGLLFCLFTGCAVNPITGKEELMLFPEEQDIAIGRQYAPEIEKQMGGEIPDPVLQNYVNYVGQNVARVSHKPYLEYSFVALNDKSINALALPGGYVYVTKGMLEKLDSEAQLAAILAHEITHIVARDVSNAMSNQIGMNLVLSAVTSKKTPQSVLTIADLAQQIVGLKYSRKDEQEADLGGLGYMFAAGYNPYGMVETMQMLQNLHQVRPIEFLSSHPSPENRIGYLTQEIQTKYYNPAGLKIAKEEYYNAVLSRLNR